MRLTFDAVVFKAKIGTLFSPERHHILKDCAWVASLRRFLKRCGIRQAEDYFVYHHVWRGSYVLAVWIQRPGSCPGIMRELEVLKGHPDRLYWTLHNEYLGCVETVPRRVPRFDYILQRVRPTFQNIREMRLKIVDERRNAERHRVADQEYLRDYVKFLKRVPHKYEELAYGIESGLVPFGLGSEDGADRLHDVAKTRRPSIVVDK